jgi:hypothetical protein
MSLLSELIEICEKELLSDVVLRSHGLIGIVLLLLSFHLFLHEFLELLGVCLS